LARTFGAAGNNADCHLMRGGIEIASDSRVSFISPSLYFFRSALEFIPNGMRGGQF